MGLEKGCILLLVFKSKDNAMQCLWIHLDSLVRVVTLDCLMNHTFFDLNFQDVSGNGEIPVRVAGFRCRATGQICSIYGRSNVHRKFIILTILDPSKS